MVILLELVEKYLATKGEATRKRYERAFVIFKEFLKDETFENLIKKERNDRRKLPENRERPMVFLLNNFIKYLSKKYAPKTINLYTLAIRDFFNEYELPIKTKRLNLPRNEPLEENKKIIIRREEVKLLVKHCRTTRDVSIILSLYSSGLSVGDLLNLSCGDVLDPLPHYGSLDSPPLLLEVRRQKNGIKYYTCLNSSACRALKTYLSERERIQHSLKYDEPLFTVSRRHGGRYVRLSVSAVDFLFQQLVIRSGIISREKLKKSSVSPCRPHALRKAFKGTLTDHNCPLDFVENSMGHKNQYSNAYFDDDGLKTRETYKKFEEFLNIEEYEETGVMNELSLLKKEHKLLTKILWHLAMENENFDLDPESSLGVLLSCMNEKGEIAEGMIDQVLDLKVSKKNLKGGETHGNKRKGSET